MCLRNKNELFRSGLSETKSITDKQTHEQTDKTENITKPHL